jgi:hypothetical protein
MNCANCTNFRWSFDTHRPEARAGTPQDNSVGGLRMCSCGWLLSLKAPSALWAVKRRWRSAVGA